MKPKNVEVSRIYEEYPKLSDIPEEKFPKHVLIIPDGNGRWAKRLHKVPSFGHKHGFKVLQKGIRKLQDLPINTLTVWAFSADNWKRDSKEIQSLMKIFDAGIKEALIDLEEKNMRFICLGRKDRIPGFLKETIEYTENKTKKYGPKIFCIALDYSGQDQEIRMMQQIQKLPKKTKIDFELITKLRDSQGIVNPADLIIRTSGEMRTSDLGWLSQNSEFYSIKKLLPDTKTEDFIDALIDYSKRERRFGARTKK